MDIVDIITKNRSYRRFCQEVELSKDHLMRWVNLARLSSSARNKQPLKYLLINTPANCAKVFNTLGWAGYLKDWDGPAEGERPSAYVIVLRDNHISNQHFSDDGIAATNLLLGAVAEGFGGCIIASIERQQLKADLRIVDYMDILCVIALGKPNETVVIDELPNGVSEKYYRDNNDVHHVPKRKLADIVIDCR